MYPHVLPKFRPLLIVHRTLFSKCRGVLHFGPPLGQTMTDLNDVIAAIERLRTDLWTTSQNVNIVSALNDLKRTVESRPKTAHSVAALVCGVLMYMLISSWAGAIWNSKPILSARYDVPIARIRIDEEPHDCDFLQAPLGVKGCSYTRETAVVKTGVNATGQHVVTYDNGKTWSPIDDPSQIQTGVFVMWKK